jgi:hypothetical protein
MSDIVTRLRVHPIPGTRPPIYGALRNEAADEIDRLRAEHERLAERYNAVVIRENEHCKDCCCARSWAALGITEHTGKSIPEHIASLRAENAALLDELETFRLGKHHNENAALREAAGKVTCLRCGGGRVCGPSNTEPCPDCAALRALLERP